jgi:hypothetical protein
MSDRRDLNMHTVTVEVYMRLDGPRIWDPQFRKDATLRRHQTVSRVPTVGEHMRARFDHCELVVFVRCKVVDVEHNASAPDFEPFAAMLVLEEAVEAPR